MERFLLFLSVLLVSAAAKNYKNTEWAFKQQHIAFWDLEKPIQEEIGHLFDDVLSRLSERDVRVPSKIAVNRMENVVDNTFIEPFFVGNSDKTSAFYYVAPPLVKWCSSYSSRSTSQMIVHKNRRIAITFDCNKNAVLPSPRTIVKTMILAVFTAAFVFVVKSIPFEFMILQAAGKCDDLQDDESDNTSESSSDSLIDDANDIVEQTSFMERLEKWDGSKMDSIYD
ncbi:unnamed protein product [Caenorhabditis sp. 36 PRJEB53466]|nr:unnamed protein product [Caenorhabditis sp. 36 PRJEB53466]